MESIFTQRDKTIETICSNLIWSRVLFPPELAGYMTLIGKMSDDELARELLISHEKLEEYLRNYARANQS